jgi:hypothetical protein
MSLLFSDGFDYYTDATSMVWDGMYGNGVAACGAAYKRNGAQGLQLGASSLGKTIVKNIVGQTTVIMGVAFYLNSTAQCYPITFWDNVGNVHVSVSVSSGVIQVYRYQGGIAIGGSYSGVSSAAWHYLEFKATIHPTTGSFTVWLDGVQIITASGVNTQVGSTTTVYQVGINGPSGSANFYDDVYVCSTGGSYNNANLGDVAVIGVLPSANGGLDQYTVAWASFLNSHGYVVGESFKDSNNNVQRCTVPGTSASSGTPTWATTGGSTTTSGGATFAVVGSGSNPGAVDWMAVNEVPPDDDSSYVTDATVSDQERFTFPAITGASVLAVSVKVRADKDDSGTRTIRMVADSSGTVGDNGADFGLSQSAYAYYQGIFETDPHTSSPWTISAVNAAEFGVKTTA